MSTTQSVEPGKSQTDEKSKKTDFSTTSGNKMRSEHRRAGLLGTLLAGTLGGAAYGIHRSAEKFLPTETRRAADQLIQAFDRLRMSRALSGEKADNNDVIQTYATLASRLAAAPIAGMEGRHFVKLLRTKLPVKNKWQPYFSDAHYDAFARGPAYGVAQLLDEHAVAAAQRAGTDSKLKKFLIEKWPDAFSKKINETAESFGASKMDVGPSLRESLAYHGTPMDAKIQPEVMKAIVNGPKFTQDKAMFGKGFSEHYKDLKKDLANGLMESSFPNYVGISHKAMGLHKILRSTLPAVIGIGALGAGGYGLVKLIKSLQRTAYEKRMMEKAEREGEKSDRQPDAEKSAAAFRKIVGFMPKIKKLVGYTDIPHKLEDFDHSTREILDAAGLPFSNEKPTAENEDIFALTRKLGLQNSIAMPDSMSKVAGNLANLRKARNVTHTHPTPAQAHSGNYRKGEFVLHGMPIKLENPKGTTRRGYKDGKEIWSRVMKADYGYFKNTKAIDGDAVDCFIGPNLESQLVVAVDQYKGDAFDETKFVLGCDTQEEGEKLYLAHYPKDWKLGPVSTCTVQQLKAWLKGGNTKKPFNGQMIKAAGSNIADRISVVNDAFNRAVETMPEGKDKEMAKKGHGVAFGSCGCRVRGCRCPSRMHDISLTLDIPCENCANEKKAAEDEPSIIGKGIGTLFSDFMPFAPSGARRSGAASLMAERIQEDPGLLLKYPMLSQVLGLMGGAALAGSMANSGNVGGAAVTGLLPWLAIQGMKRHKINEIEKLYRTKSRKRLREVDADQMVEDAMGSHRLGMAQAYDAMRRRKMKDLTAITEASDALPVATSMMGLGPAASLPFTQLIDQLESRRFIDKKADFSDQINGTTIPAYLAAAGLGSLALSMAGKKLHKDLNDPRLANMPREEWDGLAKHVSKRDLLSAQVPGLNNAFFTRAANDDESLGLMGIALNDPEVRKKVSILDPMMTKLRKQMRDHGLIAFDPAFGKASIVGHEAGHAKIEHTPGILQGLQRHLYQYSPLIAPLSAVGGMAAGLATKSTLGGLLAGTGVGLLGGAGMMFPEYMATHYGMQGLKDYKGGKFAQPGDWKRQLTALGTYGALNVLPSALTGAFGGFIGARRKKRREQEEQQAGAEPVEPDNVIRMDESARNVEKAAGSEMQKLIDAGSCCGSGCQECPYSPKHKAGSTKLRAEVKESMQ